MCYFNIIVFVIKDDIIDIIHEPFVFMLCTLHNLNNILSFINYYKTVFTLFVSFMNMLIDSIIDIET